MSRTCRGDRRSLLLTLPPDRIVASRPHAVTAGDEHLAATNTRTTGPVQCMPWCEFRDGHTDALRRADQRCFSSPTIVELSTHDLVPEDRHETAPGERAYAADTLSLFADQHPDMRLFVNLSHGDTVVARMTADEARHLMEALRGLRVMAWA